MSTAASTATASKTALFAVGGAALVGVGIAAGMWFNRPAATPAEAPVAASASAVMAEQIPSSAQVAAATGTPQEVTSPEVKPAPTPAAAEDAKPAARKPAKTKAHTEATRAPAQTAPAPAPVCATCGTVDHVRTVQKEVASTGVGAVAGGVLGGVIGNQIGKGQGKTAMTILGAIGGGVAGNQIEKQQRAETAYEITIRMDDGSTRTITQNTPAAVGTRVDVEGQQIRKLD